MIDGGTRRYFQEGRGQHRTHAVKKWKTLGMKIKAADIMARAADIIGKAAENFP
jgi:hypothetical protein